MVSACTLTMSTAVTTVGAMIPSVSLALSTSASGIRVVADAVTVFVDEVAAVTRTYVVADTIPVGIDEVAAAVGRAPTVAATVSGTYVVANAVTVGIDEVTADRIAGAAQIRSRLLEKLRAAGGTLGGCALVGRGGRCYRGTCEQASRKGQGCDAGRNGCFR